MTKLVIQHRELEAQVESLLTQLADLENNPEYQKEVEFVRKLDSLLSEYGKDFEDVRRIFDPQPTESKGSKEHANRGKPRKPVTYRNPYSNEIVVSAGGNNKILKQWKNEYPDVNIKDWIEGDQK